MLTAGFATPWAVAFLIRGAQRYAFATVLLFTAGAGR